MLLAMAAMSLKLVDLHSEKVVWCLVSIRHYGLRREGGQLQLLRQMEEGKEIRDEHSSSSKEV
jgi:hypothetical protein